MTPDDVMRLDGAPALLVQPGAAAPAAVLKVRSFGLSRNRRVVSGLCLK